jgi:hypothetical protein
VAINERYKELVKCRTTQNGGLKKGWGSMNSEKGYYPQALAKEKTRCIGKTKHVDKIIFSFNCKVNKI